MNLKKIFKNKKIIVTGHTGFKGSWLTCWLKNLGAKVIGFSISVPTKPSHYISAKINKNMTDVRGDIRNLNSLKKCFKKYQPDFVFHLAAQSLVKKSYKNPNKTWHTNLIGTLNVLESLREMKKKCVAVIITSDKCYKNIEQKKGYKEEDSLGGHDPYSASKASAELLIKSYIESFFPLKKTKVIIGVARAGNVVGGGDWAEDRLIPDCVRSWSKGKKVIIRNPKSTRPWQHVLEAAGGYLCLAVNLKLNKKLHGQPFNFGPNLSKEFTVLDVMKSMNKYWNNVHWKISSDSKKKFYESGLLRLNCKKSKKILKWQSILKLDEVIDMVSNWYSKFYQNPKNAAYNTNEQIKKYQYLMIKKGSKWAKIF